MLEIEEPPEEPEQNQQPLYSTINEAEASPTLNVSRTLRYYYQFNVGLKKSIKIFFDRLFLVSLFDRNLSLHESFFTVLLVVVVAGLSCYTLSLGLYREVEALLFCVVTASCQYSLLKSVQPDASSPVHGYNTLTPYSRPGYFIVCCLSLLSLHHITAYSDDPLPQFVLYGVNVSSLSVLNNLKYFFLYFILFFPLIFSLGLLPQLNTFLMYVLEQVDMHTFGGNATTSLTAAFFCIFRSVLAVAILSGFAYGGLIDEFLSDDLSNEGLEKTMQSGQYILYSIFCALLIAFSYHLSRSCSDYTILWQLIMKHVFPEELSDSVEMPKKSDMQSRDLPSSSTVNIPPESSFKIEEDDQYKESQEVKDADPLPRQLRKTVSARLSHDMFACSLLATVVLLLHSTTGTLSNIYSKLKYSFL